MNFAGQRYGLFRVHVGDAQYSRQRLAVRGIPQLNAQPARFLVGMGLWRLFRPRGGAGQRRAALLLSLAMCAFMSRRQTRRYSRQGKKQKLDAS
jgi:hypothetical protein